MRDRETIWTIFWMHSSTVQISYVVYSTCVVNQYGLCMFITLSHQLRYQTGNFGGRGVEENANEDSVQKIEKIPQKYTNMGMQ